MVYSTRQFIAHVSFKEHKMFTCFQIAHEAQYFEGRGGGGIGRTKEGRKSTLTG